MQKKPQKIRKNMCGENNFLKRQKGKKIMQKDTFLVRDLFICFYAIFFN